MMKTKIVFIGMLLLAFSCAYGGAVYDYDNGNVVGSPNPGTALAGQDGWVEITPGQKVRDDLGDWAGFSGLCASYNDDSQFSRKNDAFFDFGIVKGANRLAHPSGLFDHQGRTEKHLETRLDKIKSLLDGGVRCHTKGLFVVPMN